MPFNNGFISVLCVFTLPRQVLSRLMLSADFSLGLVAPFWPQEGFTSSGSSVEEPFESFFAMESFGPAPHQEVLLGLGDATTSHVEVVKQFICFFL